MLLGFKDQFVPFVEEGSKTHTIRAGNRWKQGMRADLYARPRQKGMRLLFRASTNSVQHIRLTGYEWYQRGPNPLGGNHCKNAHRGPNGEAMLIWLDGLLLCADEAEEFFRRDGFRAPGIMPSYQALQFWGEDTFFNGQVIHWNLENRWHGNEKECPY